MSDNTRIIISCLFPLLESAYYINSGLKSVHINVTVCKYVLVSQGLYVQIK